MIRPILYTSLALLTLTATADQVINDDLVVTGSINLGFDATNGEDFGYDTLRLKENNLRIVFQDTSNSGSFPSNDWQLTANDTTNGGRNYFSIDDATSGLTPFMVMAGAPDYALFVNGNGNIGLRTDSPERDLHLNSPDTPAIRFDQSTDAGLAGQIWDVAANEAGLYFSDITNGGNVPFKVRPGVATDSLIVGVNGTGLGIGSAMHQLHVREMDDQQVALFENTHATSAPRTVLQLGNNGPASLEISNTTTSATASDWQITVDDTGALLISSGGTDLFTLDSLGNLTVNGSVSDASDRDRKEGFQSVDTADVLERLAAVPMSTWRYHGDTSTHIGPMAQDFYEAFSVGPNERVISKVDADGVALASIQALYQESRSKDKEIEELRNANRALEERLNKLEILMEQL